MKSKVLRRVIALMLSLLTAVSIMSFPMTASARYTDEDIENKISYHELNCREDDCDCLEPENNKFAVVSPISKTAVDNNYSDYIKVDTYQAIQKYFDEQGFTDGLPIVPPTWIKAEKFMRYTPYSDTDVVATVNGRKVMAYQVAVNAIMSGCSAEYLPVCIAFVEALGDTAYLDSLRSGELTPMMYVNGPIARQLGIDNGQGMTTEECNIAIARFMELALINLAGLERTNAFGNVQPLVFSEAEQNCINIGWDPHHVEAGYDLNDNVITATSFAMWGNNVTPATDLPEEIMKVIAWDITEKNLGGLGAASEEDNANTKRTILITPSVAQALAKKYKTKDALENALIETARRPLWMRAYAYYYANTGGALSKTFSEVYDELKDTATEDAKLTASPSWMNGITYAEIDTVATMTKDNTDIVIQGDESRNKTQVMPGGVAVSKEIRLDTNWDTLLESMIISIVYQPLSAHYITPVDNTVKLPTADGIPAEIKISSGSRTYRLVASTTYVRGVTNLYYESSTATLHYHDGTAAQSVVLDKDTQSDFIRLMESLGVNSTFKLNKNNTITEVNVVFSSVANLIDKNIVDYSNDSFGTVVPTIAANVSDVTASSKGGSSLDGASIAVSEGLTTFNAGLEGTPVLGDETVSGFVKLNGTTVTVDPTVKAGATSIIGVDNGDGTYRTMTFVNGGDGSYKITYNRNNTLTLTSSSYYLRGGFNNWETTDAFVKTDNDDILKIVKEIPAGTYTLKVHDVGSDKWYGNGGTINDTAYRWTMDSGSDCTFKATGGTYEFKYEISTNKLSVCAAQSDAAVEPPEPEPTTMKIYFQNNWKWSEVKLYFWGSSTQTNPSWPGTAMEKYGNDGTYDIYMLEVPTDITGLIIDGKKNDNSGALDQSPDITSGWYDGICYYMHWSDGNQVKSKDISEILPTEYTVTFKNWDGTTLTTQKVAEGKSATAPTTPTKPSTAQYVYTFSGWDVNFSNIQSDLTVTAQFTESLRKYTVNFVSDGKTVDTQQIEYGKGATAPENPTKEADAQYTYTFSKWDKDFSNITGDLTVKAEYTSTVRSYTVTFVDYNGEELSKQTVEYGKSATAPQNPTRPADAQYTYTFSKWDKDFSKITGDLTVTAQYTETLNEYSVTFLDFDGRELSTQMVEYGKSATAPQAPTRENDENYAYTFSKWDKDFSVITEETIVTAQYSKTELITIYFTNDKGWNKVYCSAFSGSGSAPMPGTEMTYVTTNKYGSDVYAIKVPVDTENIVFSNGTNSQKTVTISEGIADNVGFYPTKQNASKLWLVGTYSDGNADIPPYVIYKMEIDVTVPNLVEIGSDAVINATTNSSATVTYELYKEDGTKVDTNTTGVFNVKTAGQEIGTSHTYYVVATTVVDGDTHTITSEKVTYTVTSLGDTWTVTVYFKSSSSLGYRPMLSTVGAVSDFVEHDMEKAQFLGTNKTQTGFYYWYKSTVVVDKDSPQLTLNVVSRRYDMEATTTITVSDTNNVIYLAVDNLNTGREMVNLTDCSEAERNWYSSAVHMVYDPKYDGEIASSGVAPRQVGDSNSDGTINIKDATAIQKHLAEIQVMDAVSAEVSDADSDYRLTIKDATTIQKRIAGLI